MKYTSLLLIALVSIPALSHSSQKVKELLVINPQTDAMDWPAFKNTKNFLTDDILQTQQHYVATLWNGLIIEAIRNSDYELTITFEDAGEKYLLIDNSRICALFFCLQAAFSQQLRRDKRKREILGADADKIPGHIYPMG